MKSPLRGPEEVDFFFEVGEVFVGDGEGGGETGDPGLELGEGAAGADASEDAGLRKPPFGGVGIEEKPKMPP